MTTLKEWGLFTLLAAIAGFMNGALGLGAGVALSALLVPFGFIGKKNKLMYAQP